MSIDDTPPLYRPGVFAAVTMRVLGWVEALNRRYSMVGNVPVYDNRVFGWVAGLEQDWKEIRAELDEVLKRQSELAPFQDILSDLGELTTDEAWKTFLFAGYGATAPRNIQQCPRTWQIIQRIPGLKSAMFSIFEPGKHLAPHRGPYNGVLRLHLGLIVPPEPDKLGIRVDRTLCSWHEGKVMIFDDSFEHEAWNHTTDTRVILFVDFVRPLRFPANLINWLILHAAVFTPYIREGQDKQRRWEQRFYQR